MGDVQRRGRRGALTVAQTNIFRTHGLGSFAAMTRAMTADPAMLLFLNGIENRKGAINENYGRELMELFTLGADRGAYTETDVREISRALSGWHADWVDPTGWQNFRFVAGALGLGAPRPCSARPARSAGRTPAGWCSSTRCTPRSS